MSTGESAQTTGIDTREMIAIHSVFRREFAEAPALIRSVATGDRERSGRVGEHLQLMLEMLHHHHDGEDRLLWPKLLERVPAETAPTVELMERQHEGVHAVLEEATAALARWRAGAGEADRAQLADAVERMGALLDEHLAAEEEHILPLASRCLTEAEWGQLGQEGMASVPKNRMAIVFGLIMKDGDPEVTRNMLSHAPLVPRLLLPRLAPRMAERYLRRLQPA